MKNLEIAFNKIQNHSMKEYQTCYDLLLSTFLQYYSYDYDKKKFADYDLVKLIKSLEQDNECDISVDIIPGIEVNHQNISQKFFPLASYGWDGGRSINTETFNLKMLAQSDILNGPNAEIVQVFNTNMPGMALHANNEFHLIQIFE